MPPSAAPAQAPGRPGRAPRGLSGRRRRDGLRPPPPLIALLAAAALLGVAWSVVTPALQAPDENAHLAYVQSLGERFSAPGDPAKPRFSREQALGGSLSNSDQAAASLATKMSWSKRAYARWRAADAALPPSARTSGGPNPASSNPPLYYLYEAAAYRLAHGGDLYTRLEVARLASVAWMLITVIGVWLLAGEAFARNRLLQLVAAGTAGLAPMIGFVSGSLNPDAALYAAWSLVLWLGVRLLNRGLTPGRAGALLFAVGAACLVKATSYALLPGAALVLLVGLWRTRDRRARAASVAAAAAGLVVTLGTWLVVARVTHRAAAGQVNEVTNGAGASLNLREFGSYLWQFYLPKLPFQQPFHLRAPTIPVYDIWLKQAWGAFGWLEVVFPGWLYGALTVVTVGVVVLALLGLWRSRRRLDWAPPAFLAVVAVSLLAGLHWTEYRFLTELRGPFNSGRYLLPLVGIAGLAVAQAVRVLPAARRGAAVGLVLGGLFSLSLYSLALVLVRFYA